MYSAYVHLFSLRTYVGNPRYIAVTFTTIQATTATFYWQSSTPYDGMVFPAVSWPSARWHGCILACRHGIPAMSSCPLRRLTAFTSSNNCPRRSTLQLEVPRALSPGSRIASMLPSTRVIEQQPVGKINPVVRRLHVRLPRPERAAYSDMLCKVAADLADSSIQTCPCF